MVTAAGVSYVNLTGYNDVLTNASVWLPFYIAPTSVDGLITKVASDITGTDPFYQISLIGELPFFPAGLTVYIDLNGSGDFQVQSPVSYDYSTQILSGMNSPTDFPNQVIKISYS